MVNVPLGSAVKAVLEGGPAEIPVALRVRSTLPADRKIKIPYKGGYEHFELVEEPTEKRAEKPAAEPGTRPASGTAVFRWTMRTEVAE